jgi:hypothetical protein
MGMDLTKYKVSSTDKIKLFGSSSILEKTKLLDYSLIPEGYFDLAQLGIDSNSDTELLYPISADLQWLLDEIIDLSSKLYFENDINTRDIMHGEFESYQVMFDDEVKRIIHQGNSISSVPYLKDAVYISAPDCDKEIGYIRKPFRRVLDCTSVRRKDNTVTIYSDNFAGLSEDDYKVLQGLLSQGFGEDADYYYTSEHFKILKSMLAFVNSEDVPKFRELIDIKDDEIIHINW